jgi:2-oxoglutarate ferredoxin oxidoreductase subunit delta
MAERFNAKGYQPAEFIDPEGKCTACTNCATICPDLAITVYRTRRARPARAHEQAQPQAKAASPSGR